MKRKEGETNERKPIKRQKLTQEKRSEINTKIRKRIRNNAIAVGRQEKLDRDDDITQEDINHMWCHLLWDTVTKDPNTEIIYPTNFKKYNGSVESRRKKWCATIRYGPDIPRTHRTYTTKEEACKFVIDTSISENRVKNIIYKHNGKYYCALTDNQLMLFSYESMEIVQNHVIHAHYDAILQSYYAKVTINGKLFSFHNVLHPPNPGETVDHINRHTLDNELTNLRSVSLKVQSINRTFKLSATGVRGVSERRAKGKLTGYNVRWSENSIPQKCDFWIKTHGKEKAFALAKALRYNKEMSIPEYIMGLRTD